MNAQIERILGHTPVVDIETADLVLIVPPGGEAVRVLYVAKTRYVGRMGRIMFDDEMLLKMIFVSKKILVLHGDIGE